MNAPTDNAKNNPEGAAAPKTERKVLGTSYCLPDNMGESRSSGKPLLLVDPDASAAAAIEMGMCLVSTAHRIAADADGHPIEANKGMAIAYLLDIAYALLAAGAGENGEIAEAAA